MPRDRFSLDSALERVASGWERSGHTDQDTIDVLAELCARASVWYCTRRGLVQAADQQEITQAVIADAVVALQEKDRIPADRLGGVIRRSANRHSQAMWRLRKRQAPLAFPITAREDSTPLTELEASRLVERTIALWREALARLASTNPRYAEQWRLALESGTIDRALRTNKRAFRAMRDALVVVCSKRAENMSPADPYRDLYLSILVVLEARSGRRGAGDDLSRFAQFLIDELRDTRE